MVEFCFEPLIGPDRSESCGSCIVPTNEGTARGSLHGVDTSIWAGDDILLNRHTPLKASRATKNSGRSRRHEHEGLGATVARGRTRVMSPNS
jgi:hypothetical protein